MRAAGGRARARARRCGAAASCARCVCIAAAGGAGSAVERRRACGCVRAVALPVAGCVVVAETDTLCARVQGWEDRGPARKTVQTSYNKRYDKLNKARFQVRMPRSRAAMRVRAGAHPARLLVRAQPGKRRDDRPRAHRAEASVKVAHDWELLEQVELTQVCACGGGGGALALRPC